MPSCSKCQKEFPEYTATGKLSKKTICNSCATRKCPSQQADARRLNGACREYAKKHYATPMGKVNRAWNNILKRIKHQKSYQDVLVKITKDEFTTWFLDELQKWNEATPDKKPSVDRIDATGHYEAGNMQFLEVQENRLKNSRVLRNKNAPVGTRWCSKCKEYVPIEDFYKRSNSDILSSRCKNCIRLPKPSGLCEGCGKTLPITSDGKLSRAKHCDCCKQAAYRKRKAS